MAIILSIETSTDACSVAIHCNESLLVYKIIDQPQAHATQLASLIQKATAEAELTIKEINAVAITSGPGSYTGLRIGTSTAKGLCYALSVPLISVSSLKVMAYQAQHLADKSDWLCPMIDARRMEVYSQLFDLELNPQNQLQAEIIDEHSYQSILSGRKILFFGNGSDKCKTFISHPNAQFLNQIIPNAKALGDLAFQKFNNGDFEDLFHFEPLYLKEFLVKKSLKPLF